jgi:Ala-tRNA(Pro) deacylase
MPVTKLKQFLNDNNVKYITILHSPAFTAQEIAASAHVPGKELAKTVMVKIDGEMALAVLSASERVDFTRLEIATRGRKVELAAEDEFRSRFPDCEVGAMPPFGNLYGMKTYVAADLSEDDEIAFNAGSHTELIQLSYKDFERLVEPKKMSFARLAQ